MRNSGSRFFKLMEFPALPVWFIYVLVFDPTVGQLQPIVSLLPLGRWPFLSESILPPPATSTPVASFENTAISRKLVDNFNPADTAYVEPCKGYVGNAALGCPCASPGKRCADTASICNLSNKCVCDSSLGYLDTTAKKCIRYTITTTAAPLTCPACNCVCPTTATAPVITCPTTATTAPTTTAPPTTTPKPDARCGNTYFFMPLTGPASGGRDPQDSSNSDFSCKFMKKGRVVSLANTGIVALSNRVVFYNRMVSCPGTSNTLQIRIVNFSPPPLPCDQAFLVIYDKAFCGDRIPLPGTTFTIPASLFSMAIFVSPSYGGAGLSYNFEVTCL